MHPALFFIFGAIALAGAINLLVQRTPIFSALSLVAVMGALAVLYLLLGAEFIAFIQVLVYAGAIMVLFVFVIMLLNAQQPETSRRSRVVRLVGIPVVVLLFLEVAGVFAAAYAQSPVGGGADWISVEQVGAVLFHQYLLPFEVTSVLFLVGVIGAVMLAARREPPAPSVSGTRPPGAHTQAPTPGMTAALEQPATARGGVIVPPPLPTGAGTEAKTR
ncbi:MAG: NADH-quinone oxidoreductase subunit J family protein [Terriglobales bacterium]